MDMKLTRSSIGLLIFLMPMMSQAANMYIEGSLGYFVASDVSTKEYSGTSSGITFSDFKADLEYEDDLLFRGGVGLNLNNGFRIGLSYADIALSFESATVTGSATDGTTTIDVNEPVSRGDVSSLGLTFDSDAEVLIASVFYDFKTDYSLEPFLGLGVGQADVKNLKSDENVISLTAGARYDLQDNWYLTTSASYIRIDGGEDQLDIQYDDFDVFLYDVGIGYSF